VVRGFSSDSQARSIGPYKVGNVGSERGDLLAVWSGVSAELARSEYVVITVGFK